MARKQKNNPANKAPEAPKPKRQRIKIMGPSGKLRLAWRGVE